jgi:AcrR family transcriptional regulator
MKDSPVRQNIIETASRLFYHNGYSLTGINEIIKEAGIAKATLYNHFKSKDDICLAYLAYKNSSFLKDIKEFAFKAPAGKPQLLSLFEFLRLFFKDKDFNGCWCINTVSEIPKGNAIIRKEIQHQKDQFIKVIEDLVKQNMVDLNEVESGFLAKQIYLLYEGAVSESHLHQDIWPIELAKGLCEKVLA